MSWVVHKFGGSSVASAEHYRRVARILASREEQAQAVVVSAMQGVTNTLLAACTGAATGQDYSTQLETLRQKHLECARLLGIDPAILDLDASLEEIACLLGAMALTRRADGALAEPVSGYGELWSARMLAGLLAGQGSVGRFVDARDVLVVRHGEMGPDVDWDESTRRAEGLRQSEETLVITGYIASEPDGSPTTLGRNGSDFSAAIFARLMEASDLHIWTDVSGVLSADPRLVPDAQVIDQLSYNEALELAYFGAKVIHPQTLAPAIEANIPIHIRNSLEPESTSTCIGPSGSSQFPIKGITAISDLTLVNVEGAGMIGVPGTARRVFGALKRSRISVVMISQGSSEHSICFVVRSGDAAGARESVLEEFEEELRQGYIQAVRCHEDISVLAVVGDAMAGRPGIAARFFSALADASINVRAIAQGSSERNISAVIDAKDAGRAVRAVHAAYYLSAQTLSVGLVGPGNVGAVLLDQIRSAQSRLLEEAGIDLRVRAIANSRRMVCAENAVDLDAWKSKLDAGEELDEGAFLRHIKADHLPHAAIIDCTASDEIAGLHERWLGAGVHVITANKKSNAGPAERYHALRDAMRRGGSRFFYETTVGAGLPVIETLRDLHRTGDRIHSIEGMFSGTLAYLFNRFDGSAPFSELVREAWEQGYTEPDPREDLSGMDVARKLVILAREMGLTSVSDDLARESLVPAPLEQGSAAQFVAGLADYDDAMAERLQRANEAGCVLRYTASVNADGVTEVGLSELPRSHPFANAQLTDNVIAFRTERYRDNPMVVQGPGAGPEVTAGGVFADLLRLCTSLGAKW